jgi:hypothetical protein
LVQATGQCVRPSGELRFAAANDQQRWLIAGGEWRIADGCLIGKSLDPAVATRATFKFAFERIDSVTIRAGIRSADGLNLRIAAGAVCVLLNWEVADQNHVYFGDAVKVTAPRILQQGREHTIELRQLGDEAIVLVDGALLASGVASLAGAITVYPALGSEIFVRAIDVVGDIDVGRVVVDHGASR